MMRKNKDMKLEHTEQAEEEAGRGDLDELGWPVQRVDVSGLRCYCFIDNFLLAYIINVHSDGFGKDSFGQTYHVP